MANGTASVLSLKTAEMRRWARAGSVKAKLRKALRGARSIMAKGSNLCCFQQIEKTSSADLEDLVVPQIAAKVCDLRSSMSLVLGVHVSMP